MNLVANECVQCRQPVGYVTAGSLRIPTLCVVCVADPVIMKEWGHSIAKREKPIKTVLENVQGRLGPILRCLEVAA